MQLQRLDGAQTTHSSDRREAQEGKHGQSAVPDLLLAHLGRVHAQRVEGGDPGDAAVAGLLPRLEPLGLEEREHRGLDRHKRRQRDGRRLRSGRPPVSEAKQVSKEDAGDGRHGPAAVCQLALDHPLLEVLVGREA